MATFSFAYGTNGRYQLIRHDPRDLTESIHAGCKDNIRYKITHTGLCYYRIIIKLLVLSREEVQLFVSGANPFMNCIQFVGIADT